MLGMYTAKKEAIYAFLEAAKNTYPQEFIGLLAGDKKTKKISELVVVPATYGENYSSIQFHLVPFDDNILGTAHSHPSDSNDPSSTDLRTFSKTGQIHLIACFPYNLNSIAAYENNGRKTQIKII